MKKAIYFLSVTFLFLRTTTYAQSWTELGGLNGLAANHDILSICSDRFGNIYATGDFTNVSGNYYVAKYDGTSWTELGGLNSMAANNYIWVISCDSVGNLYAGGAFTNASGNEYVAEYNGTSWTELGGLNTLSANNKIYALFCTPSGGIYAGGAFKNSSGNEYVAQYNGSSWGELGGINSLAANNQITAICGDPSGNIYAGGDFGIGSDNNPYLAKYNDTVWSAVNGTNGFSGQAYTLCSDPSGNIYYGSNEGDEVGEYHGNSWIYAVGGWNAFNGATFSIYSNSSGDIFAAGQFTDITNTYYYVAEWNGILWNPVGGIGGLNALRAPPMYGSINTICGDIYGNIYAGGFFTNDSNKYYVARYGYPSGINEINSLNTIKLSPNPTAGSFTISLGQTLSGATMRILDLTGQVLMEKTNQSGASFTFDISAQAAGLYFVEVYQGDNIWTGKVVKE